MFGFDFIMLFIVLCFFLDSAVYLENESQRIFQVQMRRKMKKISKQMTIKKSQHLDDIFLK